ncbi:hypothetical protein HDV00_012145, partial [Rhizophlyctis rosea]
MAALRRKAFLPLRVDPAAPGEPAHTSNPSSTSEPGNGPAGAPTKTRTGVLSEFIVRPAEFMDEDVLQAPTPPVENPLATRSLPTTRSYRRPIIESTEFRDETAASASAPTEGIVDAFPVHPLSGSENVAPALSANPESKPQTPRPAARPLSVPSAPPTRRFRRADYARALEPKVLLPYEARPGQTPRKIEIERRKRIYSSQSIATLIHQEIRASFHPQEGLGTIPRSQSVGELSAHSIGAMDDTNAQPVKDMADESSGPNAPHNFPSHGDFLPLEYFDDGEFEERTVWEWLHIGSRNEEQFGIVPTKIVEQSTRPPTAGSEPQLLIAEIPVPARALDGESWRDCLVVAYDELSGKWKVRWRKTDGWEFDQHGEDDTNEDDEGEDVDVDEANGEENGDD